MKKSIGDPLEENADPEKDRLLAELVELGVPIKEAGAHELVEDADCKWGQDGEEDVEEGQGPGFVDDLPGEAVLEGELRRV